MLALWLIACHLTGDYLLQSRWQAETKLRNRRVRARHVTIYTLVFVPLALVYAGDSWRAPAFLAVLFALHFATDSFRLPFSPGDLIEWRLLPQNRAAHSRGLQLTPSTWTAQPIILDQTLHLLQLALLGSLFLR